MIDDRAEEVALLGELLLGLLGGGDIAGEAEGADDRAVGVAPRELGARSPAAGAVALTVAEKVTDCAKFDGFAELVTAVVVLPLLTTWLTAAEVLVVKLALPA